MHVGEATSTLFFCTLISLVEAGTGGYVTLINASPYDWNLTYSHSYQMDFKPAQLIPAGTSHEQYVEFYYNKDDAAEATYELVGSSEPASFQLQARGSGGMHLQVYYLDTLTSLNNPERSTIPLGFEHDGGVSFILAGDGIEPYISTNPPVGWMQATLSTIGPKTLREISIPASHDAGMSQVTGFYGGIPHNTNTQSGHIFDQLVNGARWFDVRPVHLGTGWYTGHFSNFITALGATGRGLIDIVADINKFTSQHPGELIVLDLTHEMDGAGVHWKWELTVEQWQYLYEVLGHIKDLWSVTSNIPQDYTSVPLSTFIHPGSKSAVLIRLPGYAPLPRASMMCEFHDGCGYSAFIHDTHFPLVGAYSDTDDKEFLVTDQITKLQSFRITSDSTMQCSVWTITLAGIWDMISFWDEACSIIGQARLAHRMLFSRLWPVINKNTYPNLIEVDDFHNSQFTALAMAINNKYAKSAPKAAGKVRR
ncbi:PLC-like phosphodiesterase [Hyaloscypha hepaticicola]|uniref:PLC-like phosphodiesterase n=1 Tax=Hyaloscypha hepaticicola TaxID=2082293 RepID=A0A2J6QLU2_9HELO|nr:PLC-like phosphodiesterase [Hyaloscypha hepaticicola]